MAVHQANMSAWAEGMILPTYPAKTQFHSGEAWAHGILLPIWTTNTQANTQLIQSDASYIAESLYPSLERNLVGAWSPGEQRPGALLIDRQGQLDLSPSGNVHFVRDEGRWSSDSDGTNDYWTGTYDSNPIPGAFAISAWIYRDSTAGSYFGLGSSAATRQAIHLQTTNATTIRFGMYGDDLDATVTSLNGRWCHIVCQMLPDNTQQVWQDGTLINSRSAGGFFAGNGVLMLHQNSYNALSDWNGRIDDVFLWSRHLLAHEIRTLARSRGHAYRFGQAEYATSRIEKYSVLKQDLVGAWGLTNTPQPMGGTTLYDWSGRGNHGTLTNMAPATDYVINGGGRALDFDGTNDYVSGDGVDIANTPFAISAWVKTSTFNDRTYVGVGSAQAQRESLHLRFTSSTNLRFGLWNDDLNATITDPTGEWTHFVCQLDASLQQTVWQNGEQIGSRTAGGLFTGTDDWTIGRYTPTAIDFFDGEIDDVLIFPRALAPQEIRLLASRRGIIHDMHDVSPFAVQWAKASVVSELNIVVASALHSHAVDQPVITQTHAITVDEATHSHTADSPVITQTHIITVDESLHGHTADSPVITQTHIITVDESLHGHTADNVAATVGALEIDVQESTHSHIVDNVTITQTHVIAVDEASHTHAADEPLLTQTHVIAVDDSLHSHSADNITISIVIATDFAHLVVVVGLGYTLTTALGLGCTLTTTVSTGNDMVDVQKGDTVDVTGTFRDRNDTLVDPTTVSVDLEDPSRTVTTYVYGTDAELTKVSTGLYRLTVALGQEGRWYWRMYSTGYQAADTGSILVEQASW